jgi:NAD(P)-dependent dehydrogenase (short-subunit alcohol dehydrogenase family)
MGYNAFKGAVRTLTKSIAVQFDADGIRANSVHPGLMPPRRTSGITADSAIRAKCRCNVLARSMRWRMPSCSSTRTR